MGEPDLAILNALDFEPSSDCERPHAEGVHQVASWLVVISCCGGSSQMCEEHAEAYRQEWLSVVRQNRRVVCVFCGAELVPVLRFLKLGRVSS